MGLFNITGMQIVLQFIAVLKDMFARRCLFDIDICLSGQPLDCVLLVSLMYTYYAIQ